MRTTAALLRTGIVVLAVSLGAALLLANPQDFFAMHRTLFMLVTWLERSTFWAGMLFVGGAILDRVLSPRRDV